MDAEGANILHAKAIALKHQFIRSRAKPCLNLDRKNSKNSIVPRLTALIEVIYLTGTY